MIATVPENEAERLEALHETGLLDTLPEREFDDLARLAATVCGAPVALITLLDERRQWFKSRVGVEVSESPREVAFCAHAILQSQIMVVPDTSVDRRFSSNPLVTGKAGIRFYAGVPLQTAEGHRLGTLCVLDRIPRAITPEQESALTLLARQVMVQIELRRQARALERVVAERDLVEQELRASQNLFHAFMDHGPFLSFVKDTEGRMIYYNRPCAERFCISRDAWLGKTDAELWPEAMAKELRDHDLMVLERGEMLIAEEHADLSEETAARWRSYKFPITDADGRKYVAGVAVDITKDLEASEQVRRCQEELEVANARLIELSMTDSLTGLRNRRAFQEALDREFEASRQNGEKLSMLLLDVDDFKGINDRYGHVGGDIALQYVADCLRRSFRSSDLVARYGGEEFAVLLSHTGRNTALELAARACARMPEVRFEDCHLRFRSERSPRARMYETRTTSSGSRTRRYTGPNTTGRTASSALTGYPDDRD